MKTLATVAPLLAYLALPALAQGGTKELQRLNTTTVLGAPFPGGLGEDVEALYREANADPDQTRSIRFRPYSWFKENEELARTEWTWRVNVTEFGVAEDGGATPPNAGGGNFSAGRRLADPRVVNTVYDWAWPGGGDVSRAAAGDAPVCVTGLLSFYFPANVTNAYGAAEADSTSCAPVFGFPCRDAILRHTKKARSDGSTEPQACAAVNPREWLEMPECAGSWGYAASLQNGIGFATVHLNAANDSAPGNLTSLASGQGFWSARTDAFEAGEDQWLDGAVNRLHVLLVETKVNTTGRVRAEPQLLCTRVGTEKLDESVDEGGSGEGEGDDDDDEEEDEEDEDEDESTGQNLSSGGFWQYAALLASICFLWCDHGL